MADYPESLTVQEAACIIDKKGVGFLETFRSGGMETRAGMWEELIKHWWFNINPPERQQHQTLDSYIKAIGCRPIDPTTINGLMTVDEAKCVLDLNKLWPAFATWDVKPWNFPLMVVEWWYHLTLGDGRIHNTYPSIQSYLAANNCRGSSGHTCKNPYTWNPTRSRCETVEGCPEPQTWDLLDRKCVTPGTKPGPGPTPSPIAGVSTNTMILLGAGVLAVLLLRR